MKPILKMINPYLIRTDLGLHMRVEMNEKVVAEYVEDMLLGDVFPPILIFYDAKEDMYMVADGFMRLAAHLKAFPNTPILSELRLGTIDDAKLASILSNHEHGIRRWMPRKQPRIAQIDVKRDVPNPDPAPVKRRRNDDKRHEVIQALQNSKSAHLSNRAIAEHLGVSVSLVRKVRNNMTSE